MAKSPSLSNYHDNNHTPGADAPVGATFQPIYDIAEVVLIDELLRTEVLAPYLGDMPQGLISLIEEYSDLWG